MAATAASEKVLKKLATSLGALTAAIEMDVDRTDDDRKFFAAEQVSLQAAFDKVVAADAALTRHWLLVSLARQAAIVVGDMVLDRGVRAAKSRMRLELKNSALPEGADHVFPSDITEITDAERRVEPALVMEVAGRFDQVPDFAGKATTQADLVARAKRQSGAFEARDAGEAAEAKLEGALERAVAEGEDEALRFRKRMEERFLRDSKYVAGFFLEAPRKKKPSDEG